MRHITPTGHGKDGRARVQLLGSTAAVLEAIGPDGFLIVSNVGKAHDAMRLNVQMGRSTVLKYLFSSHGPNQFYELPPETIIGVDVEAWHGVPIAMWEQVQRIIETRFKTVHWG